MLFRAPILEEVRQVYLALIGFDAGAASDWLGPDLFRLFHVVMIRNETVLVWFVPRADEVAFSLFGFARLLLLLMLFGLSLTAMMSQGSKPFLSSDASRAFRAIWPWCCWTGWKFFCCCFAFLVGLCLWHHSVVMGRLAPSSKREGLTKKPSGFMSC